MHSTPHHFLPRHSRAFTLIEVLVTIVLVSVGITGILGGIRSIEAANARARTADLLQRLASEKMNDIKLMPDPSDGQDNGDFSDRSYPNVTWDVTVEASGAASVDQVTVKTTQGRASQSLTSLVYVHPTGGLSSSGLTGGGLTP